MSQLKYLIRRILRNRAALELATKHQDTEAQYRLLYALNLDYPILLDEAQKLIDHKEQLLRELLH